MSNVNRNWYPLFFLLLFLFPPYHTVYAQQQGLAGQKHQQPTVILTFDDDWPGQHRYVKPVLEKYGANATFFISCFPYDREKLPQLMMSWDQIRDLYTAGFDIQSHGFNHADLTNIPLSEAEDEISFSKSCIEGNVPGLNITIYANAYAKGGDVKPIVDLVAKHYDFARSGISNTTYLGCDGWYVEELVEPPDCRVTTDNGTVKYEHRYQMHTTSHNELDKAYKHQTELILDDFARFLDRTIMYNDDGTIKALPILAYHNIANLNETQFNWINSTTLPETFEAEIKYMHDNGIRMISMADLQYNDSTRKFNIR